MVVLDVWSDLACPWCWIGHARLAQALAGEPPGAVAVRPRAFELRPGQPLEGGAAPAVEPSIAQRVAAACAAEGLELRPPATVPNTRLAHRAVALAREQGHGPAALHALFAAHLRDGADLGDPGQLCTVVADATGLEAEGLAEALDAGGGLDDVLADEALAEDLGIHAVPCFALAGSGIGLSGAHEPALLRKLVTAGRRRAA